MLTIKGQISKDAQKAELLAGRPVQLERTYTTEDTELIRRALALGAGIDAVGNVTLPAYGSASDVVGQKTVHYLPWPYVPVDAGDAIALWENAVALDRAEGAAAAAELEEKRVAALVELAERFETWLALPEPTPLQPGQEQPYPPSQWYASGREVRLSDLPEELQGRIAARKQQRQVAVAEIERRREADAEENAAAARRRERARLELLAQLCSDWGNESVKERIAERVLPDGNPLGLLPESEAVAVVTDRLLPLDPDNGLGPYVKITKKEVRRFCVGREYDEPHDRFAFVAYDADDAEVGGLSPDEWAAVKSITAAIGRLVGAELPAEPRMQIHTEPRVHFGQCHDQDCPTWPVRRVGVLVTVTIDDVLIIEREYGAPVE